MIYRCSAGDARPGGGGVGHFGLALAEYTHFTSPIRRYADVVVHRQLLEAIQFQTNSSPHNETQVLERISATQASGAESAHEWTQARNIMTHSELSEAANVMNERHRAAKRAQKECSDLYLLLLLHRYAKL